MVTVYYESVDGSDMHEYFVPRQGIYDGDIGIDLPMPDTVEFLPFERKTINLGFSLYCNGDYWLQLETRSSWATRGLVVLGGIVDVGYRGELSLTLINLHNEPTVVIAGEAVAQAVVRQAFYPRIRRGRRRMHRSMGSSNLCR